MRADVLNLSETDARVAVDEDHAILSSDGVDPNGRSCDSGFADRSIATGNRSDFQRAGRLVGPFALRLLGVRDRDPTS